MTIDTSTTNVLLMAVIALQGWIVRELFKVKAKISVLVSVCPKLEGKTEFDSERITKMKA
jgi:hypothetical protein